MGIPVETERGPAGGYRLRRGFKLPPLMLSNDEALVMIIGLLAAQRLGLSASGAAVQGALAKLDRLLPETQRTQVQAMQDFVSLGLSPVARDHADAETILRLSTAARDQYRHSPDISLCGRRGDRASRRSVRRRVSERPLVSGQLGSLSQRDADVPARSHAGDRGHRRDTFQRPEDFDVVAYLRQAIGEAVYGTRCEVLLALSLDEAKRRVSPTDGTLEEADERHAAALQRRRPRLGGVVSRRPRVRPGGASILRSFGRPCEPWPHACRPAARGPGRRRAGVTARRREAAATWP